MNRRAYKVKTFGIKCLDFVQLGSAAERKDGYIDLDGDYSADAPDRFIHFSYRYKYGDKTIELYRKYRAYTAPDYHNMPNQVYATFLSQFETAVSFWNCKKDILVYCGRRKMEQMVPSNFSSYNTAAYSLRHIKALLGKKDFAKFAVVFGYRIRHPIPGLEGQSYYYRVPQNPKKIALASSSSPDLGAVIEYGLEAAQTGPDDL